MKKQTALKIIFIISIMGLAFSGYLSYAELFGGFCGSAKLGMGECVDVAQIPACVYGFFMYLFVFFISLCGIKSKNGNE